MTLQNSTTLINNINKYRQKMYKVAKNKKLTDIEVIEASQHLDREIIQVMLYKQEMSHLKNRR
jgi:hypothetical protein